ncbi:glutamine amidotransferase [Govanella unica]|uniref:Glutamine amidotransferase n=1 Tax=Govanella unica TaxID=2975056 RepID=A0A9X3TXT4_9PROT|nr:glutamine amidotransferase [Govania unica]MDA5193723.1 glutamine amidotransferase [Govania unica]
MSFLIIQTGSIGIKSDAGDADRMFLSALGWGQADAQVVRVFNDEPLPPAGSLRGVIITGSPAMVTDREGWSERTAEWLRGAVAGGTRMLGVCFGHQLLAHALGGEVGNNPRGPEYGPVRITPTPEAADDPLLSVLSQHSTMVYEAHNQAALRLPRGSILLAEGDGDPHQAVRYADQVWGVQFHPEFTLPVMRGLLEAERERLARAGLDVATRLEACDTEIDRIGRRFLKRFVDICG